jgi:hypothetical protein
LGLPKSVLPGSVGFPFFASLFDQYPKVPRGILITGSSYWNNSLMTLAAAESTVSPEFTHRMSRRTLRLG